MKKSLIKIGLVIFIVTLAACEDDFLDRSLRTQQTIDNILYNDAGPLISNGMAAYSYLRQWDSYGSNAMLSSASDESDFANKAAPIQRFNTGGWSKFNNPDEVLTWYYRGIFQTQDFLKNSENFTELLAIDTLTPGTKESYLRNCDDVLKLRAENRFLKSYFYFELVKRYGGVPIISEPLAVNTTNLPPRNTADECFQYIVSELDAAQENMVDYWLNYNIPNGANSVIGSGKGDGGGNDVTRLGRAEKVAAKALKLRVLLYAASPLFNPSNDISKWEAAATAGNDFLSDPDLVHWRHLWNNYGNLFYMSDQALLTSRKGKNSGIIFTRPSTPNGQVVSSIFERWNYPIGIPGAGLAVTSPSQNLVDAYEMQATGLPISDPFSGYNSNDPYTGRDPRLKLTIGVNGENFGRDVGKTTPRKIQSYVGGIDAIGVKAGATTTGYYLKKMVNPDWDLATGATARRSFILIRYAEVLLNYAEAMNEAYGPTATLSSGLSAIDAVNIVRTRPSVNMPPLPAGTNQTDLRERIRNERRVELAFEEHRFFDVRRWKIAEITETQPLMGMRVIPVDAANPVNFTYMKFEVEPRVFDASKMYLYPIPEAQISINGWSQNPNW